MVQTRGEQRILMNYVRRCTYNQNESCSCYGIANL